MSREDFETPTVLLTNQANPLVISVEIDPTSAEMLEGAARHQLIQDNQKLVRRVLALIWRIASRADSSNPPRKFTKEQAKQAFALEIEETAVLGRQETEQKRTIRDLLLQFVVLGAGIAVGIVIAGASHVASIAIAGGIVLLSVIGYLLNKDWH